ncbi:MULTISPECIES: HAD family hydrolase [Fictibacillus]|uniref:HAD family phosphatase n=1 Tax=Fictibacillus terranigra TaxID=3058424 RepID=A0ABT8EA61_9BACL|nr:HAD family phosphatase [Fictibacillus sp. CENA-BCM004]MDN4074780.1 HAD family phosphatase [Fictibacillus sp. CENA-BCM004]
MTYKAVCFDMDGVLVDTMKDHAKAWNYAFGEQGYNISEDYFYELEGMPGMQTITHVDQHRFLQLSELEQQSIYHIKRAFFVQHSQYSFYKDTVEAIKALKEAGIPIALASGSRKEFVHEVLKQLPVSFDAVITGDDVKKGKPSPEPYEKVFKQFPFAADEWIVVENAPLGIQSGADSGAHVLALLTTMPKEKLSRADEILHDHGTLKQNLLKKLRG